MYNHRGKRKKDGREYGTDFYNCSTYTLTFERETQMCFSHTVSTKALNALILETIRTTARSASVTMKSICARRSANRRLPRG